LLHRNISKPHLPPNHPFRLVACVPTAISIQLLRDRNPRQVDILHHGPDDGQTTGFCRERINLISALPNIAKEAFNGIGGTNIAMHHLREGVKRQEMFFIFGQAADGFWIPLLVFGECSPLNSAARLLSSPASKFLRVRR
jgi:hypothetical protein